MSGKRLLGIALIFMLASAAWFVLGGSVAVRTGSVTGRLGDEVSGLWGTPQLQLAPTFSAKEGTATGSAELRGSRVNVDYNLDQRRKGLLWYATYVVDFDATYRVANTGNRPATVTMAFTFPEASGSYDGFAVVVDGNEVPVRYADGRAKSSFRLPAGGVASVKTGYRTNGMERWGYQPSPDGAGVVRDFSLVMKTDFLAIDYPGDGVSPTARERSGDGWTLSWDYDSVVTGRAIGLIMPAPQNPGPLVERITFFAPVSLLFFFAALVLLTATNSIRLHPVHYGFAAAGFFAFDLLLAYLADQVNINIAFAIAAATSVGLVLGYLYVVVGKSRALIEIAISQVVFLVLFAYSFFFQGYTGLAITVGSVLTLAFFMWKTAHVDWEVVFPPRSPR